MARWGPPGPTHLFSSFAIISTGPCCQETHPNRSLWLKKCNKKGPRVPIGCEFFAKAKLSEQTIGALGPPTMRSYDPQDCLVHHPHSLADLGEGGVCDFVCAAVALV